MRYQRRQRTNAGRPSLTASGPSREAKFLHELVGHRQGARSDYGTLRVTPAMAAVIANHVWSLEEIVGALGHS